MVKKVKGRRTREVRRQKARRQTETMSDSNNKMPVRPLYCICSAAWSLGSRRYFFFKRAETRDAAAEGITMTQINKALVSAFKFIYVWRVPRQNIPSCFTEQEVKGTIPWTEEICTLIWPICDIQMNYVAHTCPYLLTNYLFSLHSFFFPEFFSTTDIHLLYGYSNVASLSNSLRMLSYCQKVDELLSHLNIFCTAMIKFHRRKCFCNKKTSL